MSVYDRNLQPINTQQVSNNELPVNAIYGTFGLFPMVYKVGKDKNDKYFLEPDVEKFQLPTKIYGDLETKAIRIWNTYVTNLKEKEGSTGAILSGQSGAGKALHKDTPVRVVNGWKPIKDIKIGDKVIGSNGQPTKVTGFYPQGVVNLYEIHFEDGRKTRTCGEHLWEVNSYPHSEQRVIVNTLDIRRILQHTECAKLSIPLCKPVLNTPFSTPHEPVDFGKRILKHLEERIPKCHLENTINHRTALLEAIMFEAKNTLNHDSTPNKFERVFITSNEHLATDIQYLARSLGYCVTLAYSHPDDPVEYTVIIEEKTHLNIIGINAIEPDEAYCIKVDAPDHLYVIEDFIVTHNTEITKIVCNYAINNSIPVISVHSLKATIDLVRFLGTFGRVVIQLDEMGKMFGGIQDMMLTMFSDMSGGEKLFLVTENEASVLGRYIRNSPSRMLYHFKFERIDKSALTEYCTDMNVDKTFLNDLLAKYNESTIFTFNHLKAIVREHLRYTNETLEEILNCLNVDILVKEVYFNLKKIFDTESKEIVEAASPSSFTRKGLDAGASYYVSLAQPNMLPNFGQRNMGGFGMGGDNNVITDTTTPATTEKVEKKKPKKTTLRITRENIINISDDNKQILFSTDGYTLTYEASDYDAGSSW